MGGTTGGGASGDAGRIGGGGAGDPSGAAGSAGGPTGAGGVPGSAGGPAGAGGVPGSAGGRGGVGGLAGTGGAPGSPRCGDYVNCSGQVLPNSSYACSAVPGEACGSFGVGDPTGACRSTTGSCPAGETCGYFFDTFECLKPASVQPAGDCAIDADCSAGQICQGPTSGGYCALPTEQTDCAGVTAGTWCFLDATTAGECSLSPATEGECGVGSACGNAEGPTQPGCYSPVACGPNSLCRASQFCTFINLATFGPTGHCT